MDRNLPNGIEERRGVSEGFRVDADALRLWVLAEVLQAVGPAHVEQPADRKEGAAPDRRLGTAAFLITFALWTPFHGAWVDLATIGILWGLAFGFYYAFGYAAFILPLLLGFWAVGTFVRPVVPRGWAPVTGLAIVLISTTAILTQSSPALPGDDVQAGGLIGWGLVEGLRSTIGHVGAWLIPLAGLPIGMLFVTQVSYAAISRVVAARLPKQPLPTPGAGARCRRYGAAPTPACPSV